jgi:hypothetical protein
MARKENKEMVIAIRVGSDLHAAFVKAAKEYGNLPVSTWARLVLTRSLMGRGSKKRGRYAKEATE